VSKEGRRISRLVAPTGATSAFAFHLARGQVGKGVGPFLDVVKIIAKFCKEAIFLLLLVQNDRNMPSPRYLTKSRFKLAAECPTKLFYTGKSKIYRDQKQEDTFLAMLAEGGYQVGELAKLLYPEGIEIESINHEEAETKTLEMLKQEKVTLFEPAIRFGDLFARVDILVKDGHDYQLIEVKAKSYDSKNPKILGARGEISSDMRPYIEDVAFQTHVFRSAFPGASLKTFLMMPDKSVQIQVSGLNQLFKIIRDGKRSKVITSPKARDLQFDKNILALVSTDEFVDMINDEGVKYLSYREKLPLLANEWAAAYKADQKIPPQPGSHCGSCEFKSIPGDGLRSGFKECWAEAYNFTESDFSEGTVLDIYNFRKKDFLISQGKVRIQSAAGEINTNSEGEKLSLSERQLMQICGIPPEEDEGGFWIAKNLMKKEMNGWTYPYHFIDFETSTVAIPFHSGMRPYEPVAFQFSHHVMYEDGTVAHIGEFLLSDPSEFPNFKFAQALKNELDKDDGTVFMWSHHENTILTKIIDQLENSPEPPSDKASLIEFLCSLVKGGNRQLYDLCQLSKDAYFHVSTKGSSSIKKVLPAVLNSSKLLRTKYSQPVYGAEKGIPSKNYLNFQWWVDSGIGLATDPYQLLKDYGTTLIGEELAPDEDPDELMIAEGGAAATAYARLQFEDMQVETREKINQALLRYCELDTLAMVMIVQAWKNHIDSTAMD